jgi:hypothetical protein
MIALLYVRTKFNVRVQDEYIRILRQTIRERINAFPSHAIMGEQSTTIHCMSGEMIGTKRTEQWMFVDPIHSSNLPIDTFATILSTPFRKISFSCSFIQYTHNLIPPEILQNTMAVWCVRQTNEASIGLYYTYDDYENLTNGYYHDFLNQSYDHLVIHGICVTYDMNHQGTYMVGYIMLLICMIIIQSTKLTILCCIWCIYCHINRPIQIVPQPVIF